MIDARLHASLVAHGWTPIPTKKPKPARPRHSRPTRARRRRCVRRTASQSRGDPDLDDADELVAGIREEGGSEPFDICRAACLVLREWDAPRFFGALERAIARGDVEIVGGGDDALVVTK